MISSKKIAEDIGKLWYDLSMKLNDLNKQKKNLESYLDRIKRFESDTAEKIKTKEQIKDMTR